MRSNFLVLALILASVVPACGGDDDSEGTKADSGGTNDDHQGGDKKDAGGKGDAGKTSDNGDQTKDAGSNPTSGTGDGKSASMKITAAKGGKLALGEASLTIPGASLDSDTTVTVATSTPSSALPDSESVQGLIYDFGPDGTTFSKPATLTLPLASKPGADEEAVISWLDEEKNAWQDLTTTTNDDGSLSAEITHFTNFAVRFNGVVSSDCDFGACGGDIVGTWTVTSVCAEIAGAVIDVCPTALATLDLTLTGSATFNDDGTSSTDFTSKSTITYTLDADCLDAITQGHPPESCDALSKEADPASGDGPTTCSGDPTDGCTCVADNPEKSEQKTGTYTIDGNSLTTTDDVDAGPSVPAEFCVKGNELRVKQPEDLAVLTWIAEKN